MPKLKTHKSTAKRFRFSGGGKLVRRLQGQGHLKRKKTPSLKSDYKGTVTVTAPAFIKRVKKLAPFIENKNK